MAAKTSLFKTPAGETEYWAAYDAALAHWPVPYTSLDVSTPFGCTHIIASGPQDAPPLVLLPGNYSSATMWCSSVASLNQAFRTYAVDAIGDLGKSIPTRLPTSRLEYAEWLLEVFKQLNLTQACIAGLSYGGFLALNFALASPERVKRLALLCPGVLSFGSPTARWAIHGMPMMLFPSRSTVRWFYQGVSVKGYAADDAGIEELIAGMRNMRPRTPLRPVFDNKEFASFKTPTLLLIGEREILYDAQSALRRAKQLIPHIQAECIANASHLLLRDQPEQVQARMLEFLTAA